MISVLMSVYNENPEEIRLSIDSVLSQTFEDFELIIVLDKPDNKEGLELLREYETKDKRVKILVNEKNIGLALSMNYAAENATGEYLLRMDSDDICMPDRFQKQYDIIIQNQYDLVCSNYDFIDENGTLLPQKAVVYNDRQLNALLPYRNIIHHPTVIMRADKFREAGAYRNYPCAQDYDLWLRMKCIGCKMHMMPEKLIKYRVRQASTTIQKRFKQACTGEYIRNLYWQKDRMSGYSYENYLDYLRKRGTDNPLANDDFIKYSNLYSEAKKNLAKGNPAKGILQFCNVFFKSKYYRPHVFQSTKFAVLSKMYR